MLALIKVLDLAQPFYFMTKNINIYLADDHQLLIDGMQAVLKTKGNFSVVGYSLNGVGLIQKVTSSKADILVMDINMPEKDGIEVLKEAAALNLPFKIIVLSSYDDLKLVKEVMKLGAKGYLTKQCAGENIVEAIEIVNSNEEYFCKTIRDKIYASFAKNNPKLSNTTSSFCSPLTERELEIIKLISLEYSGRQISEELFISTHTVETHRKNLLKKLNIKTTVGLVKYALKHNLVNP
jgi:DNA-binding NarL/FixJ family response regulator